VTRRPFDHYPTGGGEVDLRLGRYQEALAGEQFDAVICDPPYGARTHAGGREPETLRDLGKAPREIEYHPWDSGSISEFVDAMTGACRGWVVPLTSHDLVCEYQDAFERAGWYAFAPVPCVITGMSIRLAGDGPSSWAVYAVPARPRNREMQRWGTLPGAYVGTAQPGAGGGRGKPQWLMRSLVRDYSRPGDLVCDPVAGWGATALAAAAEGRRFVGAEMDQDAHREAIRRCTLGAAYGKHAEEQLDMWGQR
jgi:hypothetical protein